MKIHFPQPADVWRFGVFVAHRQIVLRSLPLMEETWELSADEAGNPVHHKDLAAGEPFGLVQHCDGVFHIADAVEQGHRGGVLGTQQTDRAQVKSPLRITEAWPEFVETRGEEFGAFRRLVGIGVCRHLRNSTLARAAGCENYLTTVVLELREADGVMHARVTGSSAELALPLGYATVGDRFAWRFAPEIFCYRRSGPSKNNPEIGARTYSIRARSRPVKATGLSLD